MTQQQALASAFPAGAKVTRQSIFLTKAQVEQAKKDAGVEMRDALVVRYAGTVGDRVVGYAYFETHPVRALQETVMVVVTADGKVDRIEILSFDEPPDYFPKPRWLQQFRGRALNDELSLKGAIHPISGASLTGRAIVNASRRILAIHRALPSK